MKKEKIKNEYADSIPIQQRFCAGDFVANYSKVSEVIKSWGEKWKERFELGSPRATPKASQRKLIKKALFGLYMKLNNRS